MQYDNYASKAETYNTYFVVIDNIKESIECTETVKKYIDRLDQIATIEEYIKQLDDIQDHLNGLIGGKGREYIKQLDDAKNYLKQLKDIEHIGQYIKDLRDAAECIKIIDCSAEQFCTLESGEKLPNLQNLYKLIKINDDVNRKELKPLRKKVNRIYLA